MLLALNIVVGFAFLRLRNKVVTKGMNQFYPRVLVF